jgi:HAE1 family hydrophobic/amphiphilic exporter-1
MNLSTASIKRYVATYLVFLTLIFLGFYFSSQMKMSYYPDFSAPVLLVMTPYRSATPLQVEQNVTKIVEKAIASSKGVDEIESTSSEGFSMILVRLKWEANLKESKDSIREKIDFITPLLPREINKPTIYEIQSLIPPPMEISFSSEKLNDIELKKFIEDKLLLYFQKLKDVGFVELVGGREKFVSIRVIPEKMKKYGLTPSKLIRMLSGDNIDYPVGLYKTGKKELLLRVNAKFNSPEELADKIIFYSGTKAVKLKDIAAVDFKIRNADSIYRVNGKKGIVLSLRKKSKGNSVNLCKDSESVVWELKKKYPFINLKIIKNESVFIEKAMKAVLNNALVGGFLAALVIFLFLGDLRSTLIIAVSIPSAIISSFVLMKIFNLSINTISLGGLALAVGMVVDASIVVIENISRNINEAGSKSFTVFDKSSKEVTSAVIASILTSIVVFLPLAFLKGLASVLLGELALTVVFSLIFSGIVALSLIPTMSYHFVKVNSETKLSKRFKYLVNKIENFYAKIIEYIILNRRRAVLTLSITLLIFVISLLPLKKIDFIMLPNVDQGEYKIELNFPAGTSIETTDIITEKIEKLVSMNLKYIDNISSTIGKGSMFGENITNQSFIFVRLKNTRKREHIDKYVSKTINLIENNRPAGLIEFKVKQVEPTEGMVRPAVDVNVYGDDIIELKRISKELIDKFGKIKGVKNLNMSMKAGKQELSFIPKRDILSYYGYTPLSLAEDLKAKYNELKTGKINIGDKTYDISITTMELNPSPRAIKISPIPGVSFPLNYFVESKLEETPLQIKRFNFQRFVEIKGDLIGGNQRELKQEIDKIIKETKIPEGYEISQRGATKAIIDSFKTLGIALIIAIFLVYVVMASQFNSFSQPFIISFTIPLAFIGIFWGLFITKTPLSMNSFLGIIVLAGIVVNNGILLIDFINQKREEGRNFKEAIIEGSRLRIRPIMMTAFTTILGMFPLAMSKAIGSEALSPLAVSVISGLLFSTIITPIIIPSLYFLFIKENR